MYDIVVKGATLIDPSQGIHEPKDIAIKDGLIADAQSKISESNASKTINAEGLCVVPGLIDLHTHVAHDLISLSIDADRYCLANGTTTAVDAGSCGELNFLPFKKFVIARAKARILAFLNIESLGMIEFSDVNSRNSNQEWPELLWLDKELHASKFANVESTAKMIEANRDSIVGLKWAHHGLAILRLARKVADETSTKIMAECRYVPESFRFLQSGDIATHIFHEARHRITGRVDGITEDGKHIHGEVFEAKRKGVLFDVGHGMGSFSWKIARLALKERLEPDTISTDLWSANVAGSVFDLPTTMEKFLHLGMSLDSVVEGTTSTPARALWREATLGTLKPGSEGDLFVFQLRAGKKVLMDSFGNSEMAEQLIVPRYVLRRGKVVKGD